jgi:hypothetical protein
MKKKLFFILTFFLHQVNYLSADPLMDIPDDIVHDWDEGYILEQKVYEQGVEEQAIDEERVKEAVQTQQNKSHQQNKSYQQKSVTVKNTGKFKQLKNNQQTNVKKYTQDINLKPYKSPLQKPVLYQKIYIKDKLK